MILDSVQLTIDSNHLILFPWHREHRASKVSTSKEREGRGAWALTCLGVRLSVYKPHIPDIAAKEAGKWGGACEICGACHLPHSLTSPRRSQDMSYRSRNHLCKDKEPCKIMGTLWRRRPSACFQVLRVLSMAACVVVCHSSGRLFQSPGS